MKVGNIGAGDVGGTPGREWAGKGHDIFFGVRQPRADKTQRLVQSFGGKAQAGTVPDATAFGEVVVLATPWQATAAAIREAGDLAGKAVIDCTNPLKPDFSGLEAGFTTSGAERVAGWARGAEVFKAFNTTGSNNMAEPVINGVRTVMFVCGDDEAVKPAILKPASDVGFDPVDAGKLVNARLLEPWAMLWIHLAFSGSEGRDFGFAILRRGSRRRFGSKDDARLAALGPNRQLARWRFSPVHYQYVAIPDGDVPRAVEPDLAGPLWGQPLLPELPRAVHSGPGRGLRPEVLAAGEDVRLLRRPPLRGKMLRC